MLSNLSKYNNKITKHRIWVQVVDQVSMAIFKLGSSKINQFYSLLAKLRNELGVSNQLWVTIVIWLSPGNPEW
jgi:hypothetical protein